MLSPIPLLGMVVHACNPNALGNFRAWEDCQEFWAILGYRGQLGLPCEVAPQISESTSPPPFPFISCA